DIVVVSTARDIPFVNLFIPLANWTALAAMLLMIAMPFAFRPLPLYLPFILNASLAGLAGAEHTYNLVTATGLLAAGLGICCATHFHTLRRFATPMWNSSEHSDQENLTWSWLRAV